MVKEMGQLIVFTLKSWYIQVNPEYKPLVILGACELVERRLCNHSPFFPWEETSSGPGKA